MYGNLWEKIIMFGRGLMQKKENNSVLKYLEI
jgi:hypothetical protein